MSERNGPTRQAPAFDGPHRAFAAVKARNGSFGHKRCFFERGDFDQHLGLLAQMEADGANVTLDVHAPLFANAVAFEAYAHDFSGKDLLRQGPQPHFGRLPLLDRACA